MATPDLTGVDAVRPEYESSIEYLAGFFDGEGCFHAATQNRTPAFRMQVTTTKESEPLMFKNRFGGNVSESRPQSSSHSRSWQWQLSNFKALVAADQLQEHLQGKSDQCETFRLALSEKRDLRERNGRFPDSAVSRLEELAEQINSSNSGQGGG